MTPQAIYTALVAHLDNNPQATRYWEDTAATEWDAQRWTGVMTEALVVAVNQAAAGEPNFICAARNHPDRYGRSEYLTIDVMGLIDDWSRPRVAIEHENAPDAPKLRYCLWKLLVVGAPTSVLVCYIDPTGRYGGCFKSIEEIEGALKEVLDAHPDLSAHLIVGKWEATAAKGWGQVFRLHPL